jgi:peptidoglycan glycosyltransferase
VLVMANSPTYDPNLIETDYRSILRARANCPQAAPLLNRATFGRYVPGSTFKVVTAGAALESGEYTMETRKTDPGYCIEYGQRVNNYDTSRPFGLVTLFQSIQYSINSFFCEIGKELGPDPASTDVWVVMPLLVPLASPAGPAGRARRSPPPPSPGAR